MKRTLLLALAFSLVGNFAMAQQDQPYDSLIASARRGSAAGKMLGQQTPALAIFVLETAIKKEPNRFEAYLAKGDAYMDYRMVEQAVEAYNQCLEMSPDNPQCLYGIFYASFIGSTKFELVNVPKQMMNQIYTSANTFLAVAPADGMRQEKANARIIGATMKLGMDNMDLLKKHQDNNVDENITEANIKALEEMIPAVKATNNQVIVAGILDRLCGYYFDNKNYAKVKEYANQAFATGQTNTSTYYYLAHVLYHQDKNLVEAEKVMIAGEKHAPYTRMQNLQLDMYSSEGKKAYQAKDYAKAVTNYTKYLAINPPNEKAWAYLAFSNYNLKKYPDAAKAFKSLKEKADKETVKIYYPNLDALVAFSEKPGAVAPAIQTILPEVEKQQEAIGKADNLYEETKYDEALATIAAPITYFQQIKDNSNLCWAYLVQGYTYQDSKKYPEAIDTYKKAVAAGGYYEPVYTNLALLLYAINQDYTEAENVLKVAVEKYPDSKRVQERYGMMFRSIADEAYDAKDFKKAIEYYKKAADYYFPADLYVFLGFAYYKLEDNENCQQALQTAIEIDPNITEEYPAVQKVLDSFN